MKAKLGAAIFEDKGPPPNSPATLETMPAQLQADRPLVVYLPAPHTHSIRTGRKAGMSARRVWCQGSV